VKRDVRIEVRATQAEKDAWAALARPYSLSEYIRQLLTKELNRREQGEAWHIEQDNAA
jgi:hypothetical protein